MPLARRKALMLDRHMLALQNRILDRPAAQLVHFGGTELQPAHAALLENLQEMRMRCRRDPGGHRHHADDCDLPALSSFHHERLGLPASELPNWVKIGPTIRWADILFCSVSGLLPNENGDNAPSGVGDYRPGTGWGEAFRKAYPALTRT